MAVDREFCRAGRLGRMGRRLLAETVAACGAAEGTLWVASADGTRIEGALNHGATPEIVETASVPAGDSVVGLVFMTGAASCIGPGDRHDPTVDEKTKLATLAMAAAPVLVESEVAAVLTVINPRGGGLFTKEALDTLQWKAFLFGLLIADAAAHG